MKNTMRMLLVALTVLAFGGVGIAAEKMDKPAEKTAKSQTVTGEVKSVDAKAGALTVKTKDKDLDLMAESKSAKNALEKVKVGDMVKVSYSEKNGKMTATSVSPVKSTGKKSESAMEKSKSTEKPATK
jgi:Cu/Ag efflux protein CusF